MALLECKDVTKRFGNLVAVDQVSFSVEPREIFGIAGPNGAGKTTLFNLVTGIYPGEGEIVFAGQRISRQPPHRICRAGIARTFQIPQLFQTLTVRDNIRVGAHFGGGAPKNEERFLDEILDLVNLRHQEHTRAGNLKLLDKKRTMIAAALATKPRLLLLDEPIAGLNPQEAREAVALLKHINAELELTLIVIEHFMKVLTEISHRLMILESGKKVCCDTPSVVVKNERVIECYLGKSQC